MQGIYESRINKLKELLSLYKTEGVLYKRFGSPNDGGYVLVDDLSKDDFVISCGIDNNIDWEKDVSPFVSGINAYDNSIQQMPEKIEGCEFYNKTISQDVFISDLVQQARNDKDLILKVDIEGAEWNLFSESDDLSMFRQIVVELHGFIHGIQDGKLFNKMVNALSNLNKDHFPVFIHGNNYSQHVDIFGNKIAQVAEILFLRKVDYPHSKGIMNFGALLSANCPCGCPQAIMEFANNDTGDI